MKWLERLFYRWECRLARRNGDLKVPEELSYGLDALGIEPAGDPMAMLKAYASALVARSSDHFSVRDGVDFVEDGDFVRFPSRVTSEARENDLVPLWHLRRPGARSAVLVLPHWNARRARAASLAKLARLCGHSCATMSLPYHDERQPAGWSYAKGLVSSNLGLTLRAVAQGACDAMDAISVLLALGYDRVILMGASIGACVASLADAHDPRPAAVFLNLMASGFADCVWSGISTAHIRKSLEGRVSLQDLRDVWAPISPGTYVRRLLDKPRKQRVIVSGRYDFTFPRQTVLTYRRQLEDSGVPHAWHDWPTGHYSLGHVPFKCLWAAVTAAHLHRLR